MYSSEQPRYFTIHTKIFFIKMIAFSPRLISINKSNDKKHKKTLPQQILFPYLFKREFSILNDYIRTYNSKKLSGRSRTQKRTLSEDRVLYVLTIIQLESVVQRYVPSSSKVFLGSLIFRMETVVCIELNVLQYSYT